jgi:iron complex transport system permease protein
VRAGVAEAPSGSTASPAQPVALALLLGAALLAVSALAITTGSAAIDTPLVARILLHELWPGAVTPDWAPGVERIVVDLRLPRVLLGLLVGAGLACVGATLQAVARNPLADPYLFGVSSGASVGAVLIIVHVGEVIGPLTLPLAAFAGALMALLLVIMVASGGGGLDRERLVLAGVAVAFVLMALTNFLVFLGDQRAAHAVVFWMLGGLGLARWEFLPPPVVVVSAGVSLLWLQARRLDALLLGDEAAASLGIGVARLRLGLFTLAAVITGTLVALAGSIGFVGLMVPHIARRLVGARHGVLLPIAALLGALLVVGVDILARVVLAPQELPIGIITAAVGGLFFIWLMRRRVR